MTRRRRVATLALAFFAVATSARATEYWVSPSGNDAATGLSPAAAWATLVQAAGEVGAGDTVHVQPGNYQGSYLNASGDLVVPLAWIAVDPSVNGVRIVADHLLEAPRFDLEVPGGLGWTASADGKKWRYRDQAGSADGVTAVLVRDLSAKNPGLVRWSIKAEGGATTLPSPDAVRLTAIVGGAGECGEVVFADPVGAKPRCTGSSERLSCR